MEQQLSQEDIEMMNDAYAGIDEANKEINRRNNRLLKVLEKAKGKAFIKNLMKLFQDCEVGTGMINAQYELTRHSCGQYQNEKYGKQIKGYWVEQWSVGCEGDSWEGYIYVELKLGKFLKVGYSM